MRKHSPRGEEKIDNANSLGVTPVCVNLGRRQAPGKPPPSNFVELGRRLLVGSGSLQV